tara:strand:- start:2637 stop:3041 length:405 start_codon:yes stop_codon:yes gene_type:complete
MIRSQTQIRVRYAETDAMRFAYHGNYVIWFDVARVEMMDGLGYPYKRLEDEGIFIPVLGVSVRYSKPAYFDDVLTIKTSIPEMPRGRMHVQYEVLRGDERLAEGESEHGFMTPAGKATRPPKVLLEHLAQYFTS